MPTRFLSLFAILAGSAAHAAEYPFVFKDVGDEAGVFPHVAGLRGHGVAWGDVDGDGFLDLFVTTFHNAGSKAGMLLRNTKGKFTLDPHEHLRTSGIGSGALSADFDRDGKLDLFGERPPRVDRPIPLVYLKPSSNFPARTRPPEAA